MQQCGDHAAEAEEVRGEVPRGGKPGGGKPGGEALEKTGIL
jgi:hypothetical protein